MSLIEEAAKRLHQLEQAGIEIARSPERPAPRQAPSAARPQKPPTADRVKGANDRTVDFARLQAAGLLTPAAPDSRLLHEFRVVKRPLIQKAIGKTAPPPANGNLIMVTSALPGEGKTFVAVNLAMSIAMEVDCTVLLVDADVVSPSIPGVLGIAPGKGLMDVLTDGNVGVGDVLLRTNVERLCVLLAGTPQGGASEVLASEAMARLLADVSSRYPDRIVVFDSPPLIATTESRVLATHMGQVLVVVEAGRTSHGVLEGALSTVESCPVVLTMLNKAPETDIGSYYGASGHER